MSKKEVLVYGSGVSGLIAAYFLNKKGFKVNIIDPFKEPKIQTIALKEGLVELAANSILMNDSVRSLLEDIDLKYLFYSEAGKKKYFFRQGKISRWPIGFFESIRLISFFIKYKFFKSKLYPLKNESLKEWSKRSLPLKFYERIFKRGLQGVYGPDVDELSATLVVKPFLNASSKSLGSISFNEGMSSFTEKLKKHLKLKGVGFYEKVPVAFKGIFVISTPTHSLPSLVPKEDQLLLEKVSYHNISTLTLFFKKEVRLSVKGFGLVYDDESPVLGTILNSDLFPNRAERDLVSETWILDARSLKGVSDALSALLEVRKKMSSFKDSDLVRYHYKNWPRAFPIYNRSLEEVLGNLKDRKDLYYFSNWTGSLGVGKLISKGDKFSERVLKESMDV